MAIEQVIITWAHLVSASIWVGGGIFLWRCFSSAFEKNVIFYRRKIRVNDQDG